MPKKNPYAPPKLSHYDSQREVPSNLRSAAEALRNEAEGRQFPLQVAPDYTTVVDTERQELIGKTYDELSAAGTNDIPIVFELFAKNGYMHGLWMLVHRTGARILVRYESWVRPDCQIQSNMELVGGSYGITRS
jgi:hypothetical protein